MDEIKNTAETEEQKVVAAEANNAETASAEVTTDTAAPEKRNEPTTKAEVIDRLKDIVYCGVFLSIKFALLCTRIPLLACVRCRPWRVGFV